MPKFSIKSAAIDHHPQDLIAIIGLGCRFPGVANSPKAFWRLLCSGRDAISKVPRERFDIEAFYDPRPGMPGKISSRYGGFLDKIDEFDAAFFGISPREAVHMDPQQRLILEVAWEAIEDAGQVRLRGSRTGVFIGIQNNEYERLQCQDLINLDLNVTIGSSRNAAAGRLSYNLGFEGPSLVIDTDRSSSLVAVHLACESLRRDECELALAGGANLILTPETSIAFSRAMALSPDGRCKFGDACADGFVRSEGVGIVVLKRLSAAKANKDPIYAVIRGSAVNHGGKSSGDLMTPSGPAQESLLRAAYHNAAVSPGQVHYVEAHGTGTQVGDPIEIKALGTVVGKGRPSDQSCAIGSVKTNIGHAEAAAGVAGLIKVALCLKHRQIPASLHFNRANPNIPFKDLGLLIPRKLTSWPNSSRAALAGVSSFGLTGTNAHVVLEEAPQWKARSRKKPYPSKAQILPLSAHSPDALDAMAGAYLKWFKNGNQKATSTVLEDVCYSASVRRMHHHHRLALVVRSKQQIVAQLKKYLNGDNQSCLANEFRENEAPKIVFVFPGQGSQWIGMGRQLLECEPLFRSMLEECEQAMKPYVNWSLIKELKKPKSKSRLSQIDVIQPTLVSFEIAIAALWSSWGIRPDAVVGTSMGEIAAAYVAGALRLKDAMRIICVRSQLLRKTSGQGKMAVVGLSMEEVQRALLGYEDRISVAASNSQTSTILSGEPSALDQVLKPLEGKNIFGRSIKVDVASHSPYMEPLLPELLRLLKGIKPRETSLSMISTVTGEKQDGLKLDPAYWASNLRKPVLFSNAMQWLLGKKHTIFIEISPHPVLWDPILDNFHQIGTKGSVLHSLKRDCDERAEMLGSLGILYSLGYPIDWNKLYSSGGKQISLPPYSWQREKFWYASERKFDALAGAKSGRPNRRKLLSQRLNGASHHERKILLRNFLRQEVATVLGLDPSCPIDCEKPLRDLRLTSLMAVELRNRIAIELGLDVLFKNFIGGSVEELTELLFTRLELPTVFLSSPPSKDLSDEMEEIVL